MDRRSLQVDVFDYADFRRFLADWLEAARELDPRVSHRWFAKRVDSNNPSILTHVLKGRRPLVDEKLDAFVRALGLEGPYEAYFRALVAFGQASDPDAASAAFARVAELRTSHRAGTVDRDAFTFFARWYIPAVHEMTRFANFQEDPAWIADRTEPRITVEEAAEALAICERLGFLQRDPDGRLHPSAPTLHTPVRVQRLATWPYHRDGLALGSRGLARLYGDPVMGRESAFLGSCFAIPADRIGEIRKLLYDVQHRICGMAEEWNATSDRVVHLTVAMVPVASAEPKDFEEEE